MQADTGVVGAGQLGREEAVAFLGGRPGGAEGLEALAGGAWSSAWAYRAGGDELVVRFGPEVSWYEADRMAMAFSGPDLPVPQVKEVGRTASGRAYAISVRHRGRFLEDTPAEQAGALAPALTRLLVALYRVPAGPDAPVTHLAAMLARQRALASPRAPASPRRGGLDRSCCRQPAVTAYRKHWGARVRTCTVATPGSQSRRAMTGSRSASSVMTVLWS